MGNGHFSHDAPNNKHSLDVKRSIERNFLKIIRVTSAEEINPKNDVVLSTRPNAKDRCATMVQSMSMHRAQTLKQDTLGL